MTSRDIILPPLSRHNCYPSLHYHSLMWQKTQGSAGINKHKINVFEGIKSLQIVKDASFLRAVQRGGNLTSTRLSAACLTMRVTWCRVPCNLKNRGEK